VVSFFFLVFLGGKWALIYFIWETFLFMGNAISLVIAMTNEQCLMSLCNQGQ
jgi:hypothetical protein